MECSHCHTAIPADSAYCQACGQGVLTPPVAPPVTLPRSVRGGAASGQVFSILLWLGVMLACGIAAVDFVRAAGAPQQAAAIGVAAIPYVFARAWDGMRRA